MNFCSLSQLFVKQRSLQHYIDLDAFDTQQQVTWPELLSDLTVLTEKLLSTEHKNGAICCADSYLFACGWLFRSYVKRKHS